MVEEIPESSEVVEEPEVGEPKLTTGELGALERAQATEKYGALL